MESSAQRAGQNCAIAESNTRLVEVGPSDRGLVMEIEVSETHTAQSLGDVLALTVKRGKYHQTALASELAEEMDRRGFQMSPHDGHFANLINDNQSQFHRYATLIEELIRIQGRSWAAEYIAALCGGRFVQDEGDEIPI